METTATYQTATGPFAAEVQDAALGPHPEALPVLTVDDAGDVLRRMYALQQEIEVLEAPFQVEIARLVTRMETAAEPLRKRLEQLREAYTEPLAEVARQNLPQGKRSLTLPYGTLRFRRVPAALAIDQEAEVLAWAGTQCPEALKVSLLKTPLTEHWKATGEVPPGTAVVPEHDTFSIALAEG